MHTCAMFQPGDRVRANWQRKGKYYDARIIDRDSGGYLVEYMMDSASSADRFENKVRGQDIIGRQHAMYIWSLQTVPACTRRCTGLHSGMPKS